MQIQVRFFSSIIRIGTWHYIETVSIYYTQVDCPRNKAIRFHQGLDTFKEEVIEEFLFSGVKPQDGKVYEFNDPLDCEFLKLAARIPATNWKFWANIRDMIKEGRSKQEIINLLSLKAISRALE